MAQTGLFEKVRKSYLKKTLIEFRACWDTQKNGQGNIRRRTSKAESEAFEAPNRKCVKVIRWIINGRKDIKIRVWKMKGLRRSIAIWTKENKGLYKVVEVMRSSIGLKEFLKGLSFGINSESLSVRILNSIEFQSIRYDNDLHADNKMCKKIIKWFIFTWWVLCKERTWQWKRRVRLGRASRGWPRGGHRQYDQARFLVAKRKWNKSDNAEKYYWPDTNVRKLYFWGKKSFCTYCIPAVFLIFLLKGLLNQQFAPLKGLGGATVSLSYQLYLFPSLFVSLLKIHYFI